jgi:glutathione S-transferase
MERVQPMKLYVTFTSPYARLARIVILEKRLQDRVEIVGVKTRTPDSPYYQVNPSGRVPYLVDDAGFGMEDSQVICAYLDGLDGRPRFHPPSATDWPTRRIEAMARSMLDGIAVWAREMGRPESERSPTTLAHEAARSQRMADRFEREVSEPVLQGPPTMGHLVLAVALETARLRRLGDLTEGRPELAAWHTRTCAAPSFKATAPP